MDTRNVSGGSDTFIFTPLALADELDQEGLSLVVDSLRQRLGALGFGDPSFQSGSKAGQLVATLAGAEDDTSLLAEALATPGVLEIRRIHLRSSEIADNFKEIVKAGPDWETLNDPTGRVHVVGHETLLSSGSVLVAEPVASGGAWNMSVQFTPEADKKFRTAMASLASRPIAVVIDDELRHAPVQSGDWTGGRLLLKLQLDELAARELAFALSAPLAVPVQVQRK